MSNKLKLHTKDYQIDSVVEEQLLYFGKISNEIINKNKTFRDIKNEDINELIEYTDVEDCDFIYFPFKFLIKKSKLEDLTELSEKHCKKILLFYNDDDDSIFNSKNSIIFRTSIYNSKKPNNYFSLPAFCNDLKKETNYFYREKNEIPTIGFCGAITHNLRKKTIEKLSNTSLLKNFLIRDNFWGGNIWGQDVRDEYVKNIINSDFVVCVRGSGNFSYRLYETLCLGKIPLIVDTDISLPFNDQQNYSEKFVIIDNLDDIESKILDYWSKISNYKELQKNLATIWSDNLSPLGFIKNLNKYKNLIKTTKYAEEFNNGFNF